MHQLFGGAVIDQQSAPGCRSAGQSQGQAGVIKLAVPVLHPTLEPILPGGGQALEGAFTPQELGGPQAGLACKGVIHREADAIKRSLPKAIGGHHEGQGLRQMGRVAQQRGALMQCLAHQGDVALCQIANASVHQLGGARRRSLGEIM